MRWRGMVDVISGGFPCQDISAAGKGAGITGTKSSLWSHMARIIGEVRPRFVFVENSPLLVSRGLAVVLGDLAALGYDARWGVLGAEHAGAPHKRHRLWIVAYSDSDRKSQPEGRIEKQRGRFGHGGQELADAYLSRPQGKVGSEARQGSNRRPVSDNGSWWHSEPDVGRVANGVARGVDRLRCLGNGQVPAVVRLAWDKLTYGMGEG